MTDYRLVDIEEYRYNQSAAIANARKVCTCCDCRHRYAGLCDQFAGYQRVPQDGWCWRCELRAERS